MNIKNLLFGTLAVITITVLGVVLFQLLRREVPPTEPPPTKGIVFWENGEEQPLTDRDSSLDNLLLQTLHRLNLQGKCTFDDEKIQQIKESNKLIERISGAPEDIKINQWIKPTERSQIPTDEDGYRILKGIETAIFVLEDELGEGLQANILISSEEEERWGCWIVRQEDGDALDMSWLGEINKILSEHKVEKPQEPEIRLVTRVIDGDTIEIETGQKVHYLGIDAPAIGMCFGKKAQIKNKELVVGKEARLYKDVSEKDKAGRLLRYVWVEDIFVNDFLVRRGYATATPIPPNTRYEEQFRQAEEEAKEGKKGIWKACQPTQPVPAKTTGDAVINPDCSQFNAPGDDNFNKKKEYVCFTNKDTSTINMKGWTVEDGWYGWTYTFPSFTLGIGKSVKVHTGCGKPSFTDLYWCKMGYEVWHNEGDTVYLRDTSRTIIDTYTYRQIPEPEPED